MLGAPGAAADGVDGDSDGGGVLHVVCRAGVPADAALAPAAHLVKPRAFFEPTLLGADSFGARGAPSGAVAGDAAPAGARVGGDGARDGAALGATSSVEATVAAAVPSAVPKATAAAPAGPAVRGGVITLLADSPGLARGAPAAAEALSHELVHAADALAHGLDLGACGGLACSEVRAAWAAECAGVWPAWRRRACAAARAAQSARLAFPDAGERCVDAVLDTCAGGKPGEAVARALGELVARENERSARGGLR